MLTRTRRPIIFGEVLFDAFPDGNRVLGGAPFNVAWHLQGFGVSPLFISRIGNDSAGEQVRAAMAGWGMDMSGVQIDDVHPTGVVSVTFDDGSPCFEILPEQAYDFIDADDALAAVVDTHPALLYSGTLAVRNLQSATALQALRKHIARHFVDINLRPPWWQLDAVARSATGAAWLKLNDEEMAALNNEASLDNEQLHFYARRMADAYGFEQLVVTLGAKGAFILHEGESIHAAPEPVADLVDTVGAGDALASVIVFGLLNEWPPAKALSCAVEFAAAICTKQGATVNDPAFYDQFKKRWLS